MESWLDGIGVSISIAGFSNILTDWQVFALRQRRDEIEFTLEWILLDTAYYVFHEDKESNVYYFIP